MGGVKPESKAFEELFEEPLFSLSLDILKERGGGAKSKPVEELLSAYVWIFFKQRGGAEPNPSFLLNFCLLE